MGARHGREIHTTFRKNRYFDKSNVLVSTSPGIYTVPIDTAEEMEIKLLNWRFVQLRSISLIDFGLDALSP